VHPSPLLRQNKAPGNGGVPPRVLVLLIHSSSARCCLRMYGNAARFTRCALYPSHRQLSPQVRVFIDWLAQLYEEKFGLLPAAPSG
jgi:DNA-binding transcriptional LysR family regulator